MVFSRCFLQWGTSSVIIFRIGTVIDLQKTHHHNANQPANPQSEQKRKHRRTSHSMALLSTLRLTAVRVCTDARYFMRGDYFFAVP